MENKSGIYKITNLINNKIYIGSAVNFRERKNGHLHRLRKNKHHSQYLQRSYNRHGEENFKFEILECVENKEDLIKREQYYIDALNPHYNTCKTAGSMLGMVHSIETKLKISEAGRGKKQSPELIERRAKSNRGKKRSLESREKMSKNRKGIIFTEEHKANIKKNNARKGKPGTMLGKTHSEEVRLKLREVSKTIQHIKCLYCDKIATPSKIARWHNDRCLNKPGIDIEKEEERRKASIETREKQSKSNKRARSKEEVRENYKNAILNRPLITCPHCNYESYNKGNMTKNHFDRCKENPNFDHEAEVIRKREWSIKLKEAAKNKELVKCPHCGYENRNRGNMMQNHFDNCKSKKMI